MNLKRREQGDPRDGEHFRGRWGERVLLHLVHFNSPNPFARHVVRIDALSAASGVVAQKVDTIVSVQ